jgi:hypothetical protein
MKMSERTVEVLQALVAEQLARPGRSGEERRRAQLQRAQAELADCAVPPRGRARRPARCPDADGRDLRPDPLGCRTAADLMAVVREYRIWSGSPAFRIMADRAGGLVAYSTLCTALRKDELPRQDVLMALVRGCDGDDRDVREFVTAWRQIKMARRDTPGRLAIARAG